MMNKMLCQDYEFVLAHLKEELSWSDSNATAFTTLVNYLLHTEHRGYVINTITGAARNLRAIKNEADLALMIAKRK